MDFCIHSRLCLHGNVPYKSPILRLLMLIKHGLILAALLHIRIILCNLRTEIKRLYHFIHTFIFCRTPASHVFSPTSTHTLFLPARNPNKSRAELFGPATREFRLLQTHTHCSWISERTFSLSFTDRHTPKAMWTHSNPDSKWHWHGLAPHQGWSCSGVFCYCCC